MDSTTNFCNPLYYKSEEIDTKFHAMDESVSSLRTEETISAPSSSIEPPAEKSPSNSKGILTPPSLRKFKMKKKALNPVEHSDKDKIGLVEEDEF